MDFIEAFEMDGLDLLNKQGAFLVPFEPEYFFVVLVFGEVFEFSPLFPADLESFSGELFAEEVEVVIDFVETHVACPNELLHGQPVLNLGDFISKQKQYDELGLDRNREFLHFVHVDPVFSLQVVRVVHSIKCVHHLLEVSVLQIQLEG